MKQSDLFRWAATQLEWARAEAAVQGKRFRNIRGIRKLNAEVMKTLTEDHPTARHLTAAELIEDAVRKEYHCPKKEVP